MSKKQLVIKHDLSVLSPQELTQYLRDVSEFVGLDPDLNALDTIWMENENGPGKSLVVYARRGTAEILRNKLGIEVSSLTQVITPQGAIVFTAIGKANGTLGSQGGRQEIAIGSKSIQGLSGKLLDDAIMTASTRALRRLTMQFTSLGILDESEVGAIKGNTGNPAAAAQLAGSPVVFPPPQAPVNNAPGKDVTNVPALPASPVVIAMNGGVKEVPTPAEVVAAGIAALAARTVGQTAGQPDPVGDTPILSPEVTPVESTTSPAPQADIKADTFESTPEQPTRPRRRKPRNAVSMEVEPEVVQTPKATPIASLSQGVAVPGVTPIPLTRKPGPAEWLEHAPAPLPPAATVAPPQAPTAATPAVPAIQIAPAPAVPIPGTSVPNPGTEFPGMPTPAQMSDYRKRVSVYTSELPSSEGLGSVQKMRAFITRMSGTAPQFMTTDQWEEMLSWFEGFVERNKVKGLITYINDNLGVK